jgi:hypothetical protein
MTLSSASVPERITTASRIFLIAWGLSVAALLAAVGGLTIGPLYKQRNASAERHAARMDARAPDPGVTSADFDLPAGASPVEVTAGVYVDRVSEFSVREGTWTVDCFVWFRWRGDGVAPGERFQVVDGSIESKVQEEAFEREGEHYERYRLTARISKYFDVSRFPRDDHQLLINIECPDHQRAELLFVADQENSSVSSRVRIPAYVAGKAQIIEKPHSYKTTRGDPRLANGVKSTYSQLRMGIPISRYSWGYYFKMFQALYVAVAIAMLAMFVKPTNVDPRFGLGVGGLFAAVANSYVTSSLVPDTGVMTLADVVNGLGIGMILITVVQSTVSLYLFERLGAEHLSRRFDQVSFAILAGGYLLLNIALPLAAS